MTDPVYRGEMQLAGWSETHTGGAKVTFWLPDSASLDSFRRLTARKNNISGQVLAVIVAEVDEEPVFGMSMVGHPDYVAAQSTENKKMADKINGLYGAQARVLKLSGFFRTPEVWRAVGADKKFLTWLRAQRCAAHAKGGCAGITEPAHVRRIANGAGTAIKPEYSAIPLCEHHHAEQHQHGESVIAPKEWFDEQRIKYVSAWAWATLKATLGYQSWSEINPAVLNTWAVKHGLNVSLPGEYR